MLGTGQVMKPKGIRGIYSTSPCGNHPVPPTTCDTDTHPFHLGVVGYIDVVAPGDGGFAIWPGSHLRFYYTFTSQSCNEPTEDHPITRDYLTANNLLTVMERLMTLYFGTSLWPIRGPQTPRGGFGEPFYTNFQN